MAASSFKFICPGCIALKKETGNLCPTCAGDFVLMHKLYSLMMKTRPHVGDMTIPQAMARLWGTFLANNGGTDEELAEARRLYEEFMGT